MVKVDFLGPIGRESAHLEVKSLRELSDVLNKDATLVKWLENSAVAVNDAIVNTLDFELKNGDVVSILPPVCGG